VLHARKDIQPLFHCCGLPIPNGQHSFPARL
jgi:hypothetical protein